MGTLANSKEQDNYNDPECSISSRSALFAYTVNGPRRDKTCLQGFQQSETQTSLLIYRDKLEIEISQISSLDMILSNKPITKARIRLRGCAGWSAPLLFATSRRQIFSHRGPNKVIKQCLQTKVHIYL